MKKYIFVISVFFYLTGFAQEIWIPSRTNNSFTLEKELLIKRLTKLVEGASKSELIPFPTAENGLTNFNIYLHEGMSPALQKKFPDIHSFAGKSLDSTIEITITCNKDQFNIRLLDRGLPFNLTSKNEAVYILKKDKTSQPRGFKCTTDHKQVNAAKNLESQQFYVPNYIPDRQLRTLRFAIAVAGETSDYFVNKAGLQSASITQRKAAVLSGIEASVNNVNVALERDLGVRLVLIDRSDDLIFLDRNTDPFSDVNTTSTGQISSEANQYIINTIGADNFDLGHIITSPRNGAGGEAVISSLCGPFKAEAITASSEPEGFAFEFTLFAHEIGHQLGGNHTQNADCQRNFSTSVEVSSGTTIMGYSGACGALDVQEASDPFFHTVSIDQILDTFLDKENFDASCTVQKTPINNNLPQFEFLPNDYFIPVGTPFFLDIVASDPDGDNLTYSWEQMDIDVGASPPVEDQLVGPQFRILNPTANSRRDFPSNFVSTEFEVLPTEERSMSFNALIRDGNPQGITYSNITLVNTVGNIPFTVSLPKGENNNDIEEFRQREMIELSWVVGVSNQSIINTPNVSIELINSTTGEQKTLIESTANDGNETIQIPSDFEGTNFRFRVNAIDNIFYNVSNPFSIIPTKNEDLIVFNHQDKIHNYLIFNIKKTNTFVDSNQIILTFKNAISGEVLNLTTNDVEISFNGADFEVLTENTVNGSSFVNEFQVRVIFDLIVNEQAIEELTLELEIINGEESSKIESKGSVIPLNLSFRNSINIFPVPTNVDGSVTFRSSFTLVNDDFIEISIFDMNGQLVQKTTISETEEQISVSGLASGVYFLHVVKNGRENADFKILIQ